MTFGAQPKRLFRELDALHESPFVEAHPPLAWFARSVRVEPFDEARCGFLAHLDEVLP
jgi:hypothetical protein